MDEAIEKLVRRVFSELNGGYHLPRLARVLAISDPLTEAQTSDPFRPYYAVDVELLNPDLLPDKSETIFKQVPLPLTLGSSEEQGLMGYPKAGTIVEVAFAYGLPHRPFVRTILPHLSALPELVPNEQAWQQSDAVKQKAFENGNWLRETFANIKDKSTTREIEASNNLETYLEELRTITGNSDESIGGFKRIIAFSALRLLTGGTLNLSAGDNLNFTTASDLNQFVAHDLKSSVGNNLQTQIENDLIESIGNIKQSIAETKQLIQVADGGSIWLGSENINVLQILSDLIQVVSELAETCASHTHPSVGASLQAGNFSSHSSSSDILKSSIDSLVDDS